MRTLWPFTWSKLLHPFSAHYIFNKNANSTALLGITFGMMSEHGSYCVNVRRGAWERCAEGSVYPKIRKTTPAPTSSEKARHLLKAFYECVWRNCRKYNCLWIKWKLVLLCSPVSFSLKPVIAFETCNSQQKEKSSVLIAGYLDLPVQTLTGWEALWNVMKETILGKEPNAETLAPAT